MCSLGFDDQEHVQAYLYADVVWEYSKSESGQLMCRVAVQPCLHGEACQVIHEDSESSLWPPLKKEHVRRLSLSSLGTRTIDEEET